MTQVAGRVETADGRPVAGARVAFVAGPGSWPDIAALTDAAGRFSLNAPQPGVFRIGCTSDSAGSGEAEVPVKATGASVTVRLGG